MLCWPKASGPTRQSFWASTKATYGLGPTQRFYRTANLNLDNLDISLMKSMKNRIPADNTHVRSKPGWWLSPPSASPSESSATQGIAGATRAERAPCHWIPISVSVLYIAWKPAWNTKGASKSRFLCREELHASILHADWPVDCQDKYQCTDLDTTSRPLRQMAEDCSLCVHGKWWQNPLLATREVNSGSWSSDSQ